MKWKHVRSGVAVNGYGYAAILEMLGWLFDFIKHCTTDSNVTWKKKKKGLKSLHHSFEC